MVQIDLSGKQVLVTGAAGGLGGACAHLLQQAGAVVIHSDLPSERTDRAKQQLGGQWIAADLRHKEGCDRLVQQAATPKLDALVHCAGLMQTKPFLTIGEAEWNQVVAVNQSSSFFLLQAAAQVMSSGSVVLFSSVAGRSGRAMAPHYAASKAAVISLTRSAALALAPKIRVNAVCPGLFLTDMWQGIMADRDQTLGAGAGEAYLQQVAAKTPLGRPGDVNELAQAVLFLVSDLSSFITGQALNVDGGLEMD